MARSKKSVLQGRDKPKDRLNQFAEIGKRFKAFRPAGEVLLRVKSLPTVFPQFDRATRLGGYPLQRVSMVHGPSGHGKTAFVLGLGQSFLQANHFFAYVDAEYTTPEDWLLDLMAEQAKKPTFVAMRPKTYEETVHGVRDFVQTIAAARDAKEIPEDTTSLIVIDSLRKLVPQNLLDKIMKEDSVDGAKGRAAMMKAALNSQWLDELVPLLYHTNSSIIFILREYQNANAMPFEKQYKVGGGNAVLFDSSLAMRVERRGYIERGSGASRKIYGQQHQVTIYKTKVAGQEDKQTRCYFHSSNGVLIPAGFDPARDVLEGCIAEGLIKKKSAGVLEDAETGETWRSIHDAVHTLSIADRQTLAMLEKRYRDLKMEG